MYDDKAGRVRLVVMGGMTATVVRVELEAADSQPHQVTIRCDSQRWGENPAWVEPAHNVGDHLLAGWNATALTAC